MTGAPSGRERESSSDRRRKRGLHQHFVRPTILASAVESTEPMPTTPRFEQRVAFVTGAGSGIGRRFAERFVEEGGRVLLCGRTRAKLEDVAQRLPSERVLLAAGSSADDTAVSKAVALVESTWGRLDVLFNNAGTFTPQTLGETSDEIWTEQLANNLTGPFVATRACLPLLRKCPTGGVVLNNSSTLGLQAIAGMAAYSIAKAGLIQLTRVLAREEAPQGVRAVAVCPGVVDTPIHTAPPESMAALHPLGRIGSVDDVASLALFLASDESSWTTGAIVSVDGGISLT